MKRRRGRFRWFERRISEDRDSLANCHRIVVIAITRKLRGQIPVSMLERVIRGVFVANSRPECRHDMDVCLTRSDGLLTGGRARGRYC